MVNVAICVGSSCHPKGSYNVTEAIRAEVKKRGLEDEISLKAAFCFGKCSHDAVTIKVNDEIVMGVTPENVPSIFDEHIVPLLK